MSRSLPASFWRKFIIILIVGIVLVAIGIGLSLAPKPLHLSLPDLLVRLPATMPSDVKLNKAEEISHPFSPYHRYTYVGANREIVIVDQLSGWNFDPDQPCMNMTATKDKSGYLPVSPKLSCTSVGKVRGNDGVTADIVQVAKNAPVDNPDIVPDFYIKVMSDRYAVKAIKGTVTVQEVEAMAADFNSYNFQNLKKSLGQ